MREVREPDPSPSRPPRLFDRVREAARVRHYSRRTESACLAWIRRFIFFHAKRHPAEMGAPEITKFLSSLAVEGNVAASTQNQALSALLFLYRDVLEQDLPWLDDVIRAKRPARLPVVLTRDEVRTLLIQMHGVPRLMAMLLYGAHVVGTGTILRRFHEAPVRHNYRVNLPVRAVTGRACARPAPARPAGYAAR
jgi:integrase